jgi:mono/diheme cytochrome c family protein
MSRFRKQFGVALLLLGVSLFGGACRRDMQDQPKMKPYRGTSFFGDNLSMRQPIEGTIPRGWLRSDKALFTGKNNTNPNAAAAQQSANSSGNTSATGNKNAYPDDIDKFPFPITEEIVQRGRERYEIFCVVCHGFTGHGDGMVVRRGYRRAADFHETRLLAAPVGHFFDAVTNGWGAMPSYAPQIPVQDRWAIIAYVRALQLSQQNVQLPSPVPGSSPLPSPTPSAGGHQ